MRDDTITVRGPFEIEPLWCEAYDSEDDDGNPVTIEAHWISMEHMRRFEFETRACPCGRLHGFVMDIQWALALETRSFAEWVIDSGFAALKRSLDDCGGAA